MLWRMTPRIVTDTDLDWLKDKGHTVDRKPVVLKDGRKYYHIDGVPHSEEQIVRHITEGRKLGD
jgi:hypothetical protein